jgi:hypothetical protein
MRTNWNKCHTTEPSNPGKRRPLMRITGQCHRYSENETSPVLVSIRLKGINTLVKLSDELSMSDTVRHDETERIKTTETKISLGLSGVKNTKQLTINK